MPAVSFILSLNTTALFHLGELPHPETGQKTINYRKRIFFGAEGIDSMLSYFS